MIEMKGTWRSRAAGGHAWQLVASWLIFACGMAMCGGVLVPASAAGSCSNEPRRVEQAYGAALPDCRAYELVSPLEKDDNGVSFTDSRASMSDTSPALIYYSPGSFGEAHSAFLDSPYLSRRGANAWSTQDISPPYADYLQSAVNETSYPFGELLFTPDLSRGLVLSKFTPLVGDEPAGFINLYIGNVDDDLYETVSNVLPEEPPFAHGSPVPQPEGASIDFEHVVFQSFASLVPGASHGEHEHVYEWSGGKLSQVDIGTGSATLSLEGSANVGSSQFNEPIIYGNAWHAVSSDGSRVFFTDGIEDKGTKQLFLRENAASPVEDCAIAEDACTVEVSGSQRTDTEGNPAPDPHGPQSAYYRDASVDGARVFFTSRAELTNDAYTGVEDNAANLYEYSVETGVLHDLTVDRSDAHGAAVVGLVAASEDGSYVYFVANGVLADGAPAGDCKIEEEREPALVDRACDLYVEHYDGSEWEPPRFIAQLAGSTTQEFDREQSSGRFENHDEMDWVGYERSNSDYGPGWHTARVTADGTRLAFESELSPTRYDNALSPSSEPGDCGESGRCREVYLYNAVTQNLVCVSCNPDPAAQPTGPAELGGHEVEPAGGGLGVEPSPYYVPRNLSEGGGRLFFQSPDALVPQDSNGLLDVYEWEQPGVGSCTEDSSNFTPGSGGCIFAISDVAGGHESHFMDASSSGDNVFIATSNQLVPEADEDTRTNVYDARVGGGFSVMSALPACVNADSCKPPVSPQPGVLAPPASATFAGTGNAIPLSRPRGVVKPRPLTSGQQLTRALKSCRKKYKRSERRRAACGRDARKRYRKGK
jgi:hypothetical protein